MFRGGRLKHKEVINLRTAQRIGFVSDIEIDEKEGKITAIVVIRGGIFRRMLGMGEYVIPWSEIIAISDEFVLADMYALKIV